MAASTQTGWVIPEWGAMQIQRSMQMDLSSVWYPSQPSFLETKPAKVKEGNGWKKPAWYFYANEEETILMGPYDTESEAKAHHQAYCIGK